jgi:hypothetical protein
MLPGNKRKKITEPTNAALSFFLKNIRNTGIGMLTPSPGCRLKMPDPGAKLFTIDYIDNKNLKNKISVAQ